MRKRSLFFWAGAVLLGLSLAAGPAMADVSADKKDPPKAAKGKPGDACKGDSDCDSSDRPVRCRDGKCETFKSHPVT